MVALLLTLVLIGCGGSTPAPAAPVDAGWANIAPASVVEAVHGDGKSYLHIQEGAFDYWASVPKMDVAAGDFVELGKGPMRYSVKSKELDRTFPEIIEIDQAKKITAAEAEAMLALAPPEGGQSIEQIYADRTNLSGKDVAVRGRVVKAAKGIFGANWYHLRDGTGAEGTNDLTITSQIDAEVGDILTAKGKLTIDKDLGFGYFYAAIIEDASVEKS